MQEKEQIDLFDYWERIPENIQDLLNISQDATYNDLAKLLTKLNKLGYTFEYGLDHEPYNLRKI